MTRGIVLKGATPLASASLSAVTTSTYNGSPVLPGSFVRSNTAMVFVVAGNALAKCSTENGRYKRTLSTPIFSPFGSRYSTVSCAISAPEHITTMTRSASFAPT